MKNFLLLLAVATLAGCTPSEERPLYDKLSTFLADNPPSKPAGRAYFVERYSEILNEWNDVILIYGYPDDYAACDVLLKLIRNEEPRFEWRCSPAN